MVELPSTIERKSTTDGRGNRLARPRPGGCRDARYAPRTKSATRFTSTVAVRAAACS
jgi:hypothetical protein